MGSSKQFQCKNHITSSSVIPTYPALRPSRSLVSRPTPTSKQAHPVTQAQLEHAARFGHSFARISLFPPEQKNSTGLPDNLKAGVENLSGMSMDDVNVHYNSSQPASVQALAYTQGTEIHVGPGQEKHVPHEAWHVVQQKQGRVEATMQAKGVMINDDEGLEREASVMGERANQIGTGDVQRKGISEVSFLEEEVRHPLEPVQQYRVDADTPSIMQFVKQTPNYAPGNNATNVTFALNNGDTYDRGSRPGVEPDGWDELRTLGLTQGNDNWHLWVLFHVLNADAGGSGMTKGNLTPTTQQANHIQKWNRFERNILKTYIPQDAPIVVDAVNFNADVGYHSPGTFYWQETGGGTGEVETESSDYPKNISAQLSVTWTAIGWAVPKVFPVNLDESDGLIPPEELTSVPGWQAYADDAHTEPYDGTKP